jgi:hypothetical protein
MREAHALNEAGCYAAKLHDLPLARAHCGASLDLARRHGDLDAQARTQDSMGYIATWSGHHDRATATRRRAISLFLSRHRIPDAHRVAARLDDA